MLLQEQRRAHTIKWAAIYLFAGIAMAAVCARTHVRARASSHARLRSHAGVLGPDGRLDHNVLEVDGAFGGTAGALPREPTLLRRFIVFTVLT